MQMKEQQAQERRILPPNHPDVLIVKRVFEGIINSALQGKGGGYQEHMKVWRGASLIAAVQCTISGQ